MIDYDLAFLADTIYSSWSEVQKRVARRSWRLVRHFDHQGTQAALFNKGNDWVLCFRGTQASEFSILDFFSNFGIPVPWSGPGLVHSGYLHHLERVRYAARKAAEQVPNDAKLWITGHSMGGALSVLYSAWVLGGAPEYRHRIYGLVTFGAPKSLNEEACVPIIRAREQLGLVVRQHVMPMDFAPYWPILLFTNPGPEIIDQPNSWWPGPLSRHSATEYLAAQSVVR